MPVDVQPPAQLQLLHLLYPPQPGADPGDIAHGRQEIRRGSPTDRDEEGERHRGERGQARLRGGAGAMHAAVRPVIDEPVQSLRMLTVLRRSWFLLSPIWGRVGEARRTDTAHGARRTVGERGASTHARDPWVLPSPPAKPRHGGWGGEGMTGEDLGRVRREKAVRVRRGGGMGCASEEGERGPSRMRRYVGAAEAGVGAGAEAGVEAASRLPSSSKGTDKGKGKSLHSRARELNPGARTRRTEPAAIS